MDIKWNNKNDSWPRATTELRDHIYIVSDGKEMTIARWANLCYEDPDCGADPDEFDFLPVKDIEILYWYGPVSKPICDISEYQPERSKREDSIKITTVINDNSGLPKIVFSQDMLTKKESRCGALNSVET